MKILLVDDNPILINDILKNYGYQVDIAENGFNALKILAEKTQQYDLVILDLKMPIMNGWELLKSIKNKPDLVHLSILILTADTSIESTNKCLHMGANYYVTKPLNPSQFIESIQKIENNIQSNILKNLKNSFEEILKEKFLLTNNIPLHILTQREIEILQFISTGLSHKKIARYFNISETTVKNHLIHISSKLRSKYTTSIAEAWFKD